MAGHAQLKFVMTECSKTQIRLTRLIYSFQVDKGNTSDDNKTNLDPRPPILTKDDLITDAEQFTEVDQHARSVNINLEQ